MNEWIELTDEDRESAFFSMPDALDGFLKKWGLLNFAKAVEAICREKNATPSPAWCASVDAELAATAEADAQPIAREPLTDEQIEDLRGDANRGYNIEREDYFKAFRDAERAHGIKCLTCNGHGLVGGLQGGKGAGYVCEDCPDCNAPAPTLPATAVAEGARLYGESLEPSE